jgi:uncharacterized membrane protein YjjB (DUF3815 family)
LTILLKAHLRDAVWIVIAGALAVGGAKLGVQVFSARNWACFLGALIVGIASNWLFAFAGSSGDDYSSSWHSCCWFPAA